MKMEKTIWPGMTMSSPHFEPWDFLVNTPSTDQNIDCKIKRCSLRSIFK